MRQIFEFLIIHKPSLEPREVPHKIWAWSVQPFKRFLVANKQTDALRSKVYIEEDIKSSIEYFFSYVVNALLHKGFSSPYLSRYNSVLVYYQCQNQNTFSWTINAKPKGTIL